MRHLFLIFSSIFGLLHKCQVINCMESDLHFKNQSVRITKICLFGSSLDRISQNFRFHIFQGHLWSSEVKLGSNSSNRGQLSPVSRNISNIHMFRLRMLIYILIGQNRNFVKCREILRNFEFTDALDSPITVHVWTRGLIIMVTSGCLPIISDFSNKESILNRNKNVQIS